MSSMCTISLPQMAAARSFRVAGTALTPIVSVRKMSVHIASICFWAGSQWNPEQAERKSAVCVQSSNERSMKAVAKLFQKASVRFSAPLTTPN